MFNPLTALEVCEMVAEGRLPPSPSVIDLGNQTYGVDPKTLARIVDRLRPLAPDRGIDLAGLQALSAHHVAKARHASGEPVTERFYRALGFSGYTAIDINSRFGSLVMDLNQDLDHHYGFSRRHDLVVNTGTSEHVFNQAAFLRNAHNLADTGGLMLHIVPFTGYMNHGFYNYQPNLFFDLAAANGYELLRLRLADRDGALLDLRAPSDLAAYFPSFLELATPNVKGNTFLVALLRRTSPAEFVYPCQGKYLSTLEGSPRQEYLGRQESRRMSLFLPERPPAAEGRAARMRRSLKRSLLKSLRRASRTVLLRF